MAKRKLSSDIKEKARSKAYDKTHDLTDDDASGSKTPSGNHCINPALNDVRLERIRCWSGGKAVIRILGKVDETDKTSVLPGRLGPRPAEIGGMSFYGPCVTAPWIGCSKDNADGINIQNSKQSTFIVSERTPSNKGLKYARETYDVTKEGVPFWNLPYAAAYQVMRNACEEGIVSDKGLWDPSWVKLFTGKSPAIPVMKLVYYAVGVVYELGPDVNTSHLKYDKYNKDTGKKEAQIVERNGVPYGLGDDDELQVVWVTKSCGDNIIKLCQHLKEDGWDGDSDANPAGLYSYGDPCGVQNAKGGIDGGLFFTIFNPKVWQPPNSKHTTWNGVIPEPEAFSGYECKVSPGYTDDEGRKYRASLTPEQVEKFVLKNKPGWKDDDTDGDHLLKVVSIEEEASLVARGFADDGIRQILPFFWASYPEYQDFPDVAAIIRDRKSFSMPEEAFDGVAEGLSALEQEVGGMLQPAVAMSEDDFDELNSEFDAFEDVGGGDGPLVSTSPTPTARTSSLNTTPDEDDFEGGEIEAEATAADDEEFDDFAGAFKSDFNEEDASPSEEFDPEEEAADVEASMEDSMTKATSALAAASKSQRQSAPRKLKKRS